MCRACYLTSNRKSGPGGPVILDSIKSVLQREAELAPQLLGIPRIYGEWMLLCDPHVPFHNPQTVANMVEDAQYLGVGKLCVPGDLIHADTISQYDSRGKTVAIVKELEAAGRVLTALESYFDEIVVIVGNHDQRIEKLIAKSKSSGNRNLLSMLAGVMGVEEEPESITSGILDHYLGSPKITIHPLPEIIINDSWLIQHPSTCSRMPPKTQKDMIHKWRMSVVGGHNHLWGLGFDNSGIDVAFNIGPSCLDEKFRYVREKPGTFPRPVNGYGAILLEDGGDKGGYLVPIANHKRMFSIKLLAERLRRRSE